MTQPLETLITGFGAFGNVIDNPTERLLHRLSNVGARGHHLTLQQLPTAYYRAARIAQRAIDGGGLTGPFDIVLMLGVARLSAGWRVERYGRNLSGGAADIDGYRRPLGPIVRNGPVLADVRFPVEETVAALELAGLPAFASEDAGPFLCNHLLYSVLEYGNTPRICGFLHVPPDEQTYGPGTSASPIFPFETHVKAIRVVLDTLGRYCTGAMGGRPVPKSIAL